MTKKLIISFLFCINLAFSQGEANIWYFGYNAGLDFNSGNPIALNDGQAYTLEGTSVISNSSGQLLFYTDGMTVWDKTHQIMPNGTGLLGEYSSTQSALIVPQPGSPNIYIVFTATSMTNDDGINYSIVDLSLNGGLGAVTVKNFNLIPGEVCEKLAAVKHSNGQDYWVLAHGFNNNSFHAYRVTPTGVDINPVITNIGTICNIEYSKFGYLKFFSGGTKLIAAVNSDLGGSYYSGLDIFDFNASTGVLSNYQAIPTGERINYGIEFSPSGNILYTSSIEYPSVGFDARDTIEQYDLTATDIVSTRTVLYSYEEMVQYFEIGALQLGPDGKIYASMDNRTSLNFYISRIENPDVLGLGCNFVLQAVNLSPGYCSLGLPQFAQSFFNVGFNVANTCLGDVTTFTPTSNATVTSATWDFGDGATSTNLNPTHVYTNPGTYNVFATFSNGSETTTHSKQVKIASFPTASQPNPILVCDTDNDGFNTFNLTQNETFILNGQSSSDYGVNYYASASDFANKIRITNPTSYQNSLVSFQAQNIIAEVYNIENSSCNAVTNFNIQVFEKPTPSTSILPIQNCDNTTFGSNLDGKVVFDLTDRTVEILNGQSASDFTLYYYKDIGLTNLISNPTSYVNTSQIETIFVKVVNNQNINCFAISSFQIEVFSIPMINSVVSLKQCDDNNDGFSFFNLMEANELITGSTAGLTFSYFETFTQAEDNDNPILNFTNYSNQMVNTDQIFVRVENANGCYTVATLNLIVSTTSIPSTFQKAFTVCDDSASGSNMDGIATFDFSSVTSEVQALFPVGQLLDITYYKNVNDALAEQNSITAISNYTNTGYPDTQNIYIRVDSQLDNECLGLGHHITLNVEKLPIIQSLIYKECDDDQDGVFSFDTSNLETDILAGLNNVTLSYWDENNNPLPSPLPNPFNTSSQSIKVRATNNTPMACYFEATITFTVDDLPEIFPIPISLTTVCDDEDNPINQDGLFAFETSTFQAILLGNQVGMIVKYFDANGNLLSTPLPNPFVSATQNITVQVTSPNNTSCITTSVIPLIVNKIPNIELSGDELICSDNPNFTKTIDAGLIDNSSVNNYTYNWFLNGDQIPSVTNYELVINTAGIYEVEVQNVSGCIATRRITVIASNSATIETIEVVDLSDNNSIAVFVSGLGDYVYSLDNLFYQESNYFGSILFIMGKYKNIIFVYAKFSRNIFHSIRFSRALVC